MSKKIIYLLSLLMALSLVFASCKKNNGLDPNDTSFKPDEVPDYNNTGKTGEDGLFKSYNDLTHTEPLDKKEVTKGNGTDYVRNPIIVNLGKGNLVVFAEYRWRRSGAINDVGIDGTGVVDIVYYTSKDSGKTWITREKYVNQNGMRTETADKSHGAPVVFYDKDKGNQIVIVASSGVGIGRDSTEPSKRKKSRVDYIKGTVTVNHKGDPTIAWNTDWTEIGKIEEKLSSITFTGSIKPTQFGTHSARGVIGSDNKLYLPVTVAYQGYNSDKWSTTYELMGHILVTANSIDDLNWTVGNAVTYDVKGQFTKYKEARATSSTKYLVVPNPSYSHNIMGKGTLGSGTVSDNTVTASEGSAGYLLVPQWFGSQAYTINNNGSGEVSIAQNGSQPEANNVGILTHVQGQDVNMHMYVVNADGESKKNTGSYKIVDRGKSSSIDILEDGTIITAAEEGLAGENRNYYLVFTRYSQKFINDKTGGK